MLKKTLVLGMVAFIAISFIYGCTVSVDDFVDTGDSEDQGTDNETNGESGEQTQETGTWQDYSFYDFDGGEHFVYELTSSGSSGTFTIDVGEIQNDGTVDMTFELVLDGETYEASITTEPSSWSSTLTNCDYEENPMGCGSQTYIALFAEATLGTYLWWFEYAEFAEFTWSQGGQTISVDPNTGSNSYAGISCTTGEIQIDGAKVYEACYSPDLEYALHSSYYDADTGEQTYAITLTEYSE